jgi:hypothetical protein
MSFGPRYQHARNHLVDLSGSDAAACPKIRAHLQQLLSNLACESSGASEALQLERSQIDSRIKDFDLLTSLPYQRFQERGWDAMKFPELVSVCEILAREAGVTIDREAKRRKTVLYKWLADNWAVLDPQIDCIELKFSDD